MNIRDFKTSDKEVYISMSHAFYNSDACDHGVPHTHSFHTFEHIMIDTDTLYGKIIEDNDNCVIGYLLFSTFYSCEFDAYTLFIDELFIDESSRNQSYGTKVFEYFFKHYPKDKYTYRLEVSHDNLKALKFYNKLGFKSRDYLQLCL